MCKICEIFGKRVKELRKKQNLTQNQFAKKSGLHKNYIGMVERGERNISLKNIARLAKTFNVEIQDLFTDKD